MSKNKRNVAYIKPEEPAFLKRIKQEIGYKETEDHLEMKKGPIQNISDDDDDDLERDDEKPIIVQLKDGDLSKEEAERIAKEEEEKPADLDQKIVFKIRKKKDDKDNGEKNKLKEKSDKKSNKEKPAKNLLSFQDEDE